MSYPAYVIKETDKGELKYQRRKHADVIFDDSLSNDETLGDFIPSLEFVETQEINETDNIESLIKTKNPSSFWLNGTYHLNCSPYSDRIFIPIENQLDEDIIHMYMIIANAIEEYGENFDIEELNYASNKFLDSTPYLAIEIAESSDYRTDKILEFMEARFGEVKDFR